MRKRSIGKKYRRFPIYKEVNQGKSVKLEIYGNLTPKEDDITTVCFKVFYSSATANTEYQQSPLYDLCALAKSNMVIVDNYSYMSLYSITFEVFPNKWNGQIPAGCPILFGLYKGNNPDTCSYNVFYATNNAFPISNDYQKKYFVINSPYYNTEQWDTNIPQYHIMIRQYDSLGSNNYFTSQSFKISCYFRLRSPMN